MITLLTGDIHLSENPRDAYRFEFLDWLRSTIKRKSVERLIIVGDITDQKDLHSAWLTNAIADNVKALADLCPVTILMGNHDYLISSNPFFEFLHHIPNVEWIGKPTMIGNELFLPHTRNYKKDWNFVEFGVNTIFCHNTFAGTKIRDQELDGIPNDVFPKSTEVWSGDVHVPQRVGINIRYVGAPYTINFGDTYQGRVVLLDGPGVQSIKYDGKQKRLIEIPNISSLAKYTSKANGGDIVRARIKLDLESQGRWEGIKNSIKQWAEENKFVLDSIQPILEHRIAKSYKKVDKQSDEDLVRSFANRTQVPPGTLKTGLKFL